MRSRAILLLTAALVVALDRWTKAWVRAHAVPGETFWHWGRVVAFTYVLNRGAAFGLFPNGTALFVVVAIGLLAAVVYLGATRHHWAVSTAIGFGLLAGGAIGNLWDRLGAGEVVDFINLHWWPVFNVADSAIVVGMVLLVFEAWRRDSGDARSGNTRSTSHNRRGAG
ncbi:MAG: signal peptidase II [Firmicutes bacterium]|nr:signal peptidase II [Alicyclobacillaceae bacterium]MCL6496504.1 signal peptidase II [Bacillota bacterium]